MIGYIKIAAFTYPSQYAVLKLVLEQEEIRFYFENETIISVLPFHSNAMGGIFLKVHPDDVNRAKEILSNFNSPSNLHIV